MKFLPLQKDSGRGRRCWSRNIPPGEDFTPAKLGAAHLFFKSGRKVYYLPYGAVTRCFRSNT